MQQIHSCIDIDATPSLVWAILTDFGSYKRWNPLIRAIVGKPSTETRCGSPSSVRARAGIGPLHPDLPSRAARTALETAAAGARPVTTEPPLRIESLPAAGVRFHQTEQIQGLFAALVAAAASGRPRRVFHA